MSAWFEAWFRNKAYLSLYGHRNRDEARACIKLIVDATRPNEGASVLDLASGPGRHAIELALLGFSVTAVDLSPTLVEHAIAKATDEGVTIRFIESDMRAIEFQNEFDLAVQLFTSFGYFDNPEDDMLVLHNLRRSLHQGGYYALDLINPERLRATLVEESERTVGEIVINERRRIELSRVIKEITLHGTDGSVANFHESVRLYTPDEIELMLRTAGFEPVEWFGNYYGAAFDHNLSERMLVISRAVDIQH